MFLQMLTFICYKYRHGGAPHSLRDQHLNVLVSGVQGVQISLLDSISVNHSAIIFADKYHVPTFANCTGSIHMYTLMPT